MCDFDTSVCTCMCENKMSHAPLPSSHERGISDVLCAQPYKSRAGRKRLIQSETISLGEKFATCRICKKSTMSCWMREMWIPWPSLTANSSTRTAKNSERSDEKTFAQCCWWASLLWLFLGVVVVVAAVASPAKVIVAAAVAVDDDYDAVAHTCYLLVSAH